MQDLTGGCFCGRVRYRMPIASVRFGFASCHCSICRRMHGAPFVQWTGIARDASATFVVDDAAAVTAFDATPAARRMFCGRCGTHTHLVYGGDGPWAGEVHVATATIDAVCVPALEAHVAKLGKPRYIHVYYSDRSAALGELGEWVRGPKYGGTSGLEPEPPAVGRIAMKAEVRDGAQRETVRYPADEILLRVVDNGEVQVIEYRSEDRDATPPHSHPWDELEYVIEGEVEFFVGDRWTLAGPGSVQMLPAGTPHTVRVPRGSARVLMVTIGAPYDGFARDIAAVIANSPVDPAKLVAAAAKHGVRLA